MTKKLDKILNIQPYSKVKHLIKEGDVLLFRGRGFIPFFIGIKGKGIHTHAGVASWHKNGGNKLSLECIEFREFKGGRIVSLDTQVKNHSKNIDVFRPCDTHIKSIFNKQKGIVEEKTYNLYARDLTNDMRKISGQPYGWRNIIRMAFTDLFLFRFFFLVDIDDNRPSNGAFPVCSTYVVRYFRKHYVDLVNWKADVFVEPADLARSPILNYIFTLEYDT